VTGICSSGITQPKRNFFETHTTWVPCQGFHENDQWLQYRSTAKVQKTPPPKYVRTREQKTNNKTKSSYLADARTNPTMDTKVLVRDEPSQRHGVKSIHEGSIDNWTVLLYAYRKIHQ
jgi:hypothetical protein